MDIMSQSVNQELIEFLDNSPTCFQAVENFRKMLKDAGYSGAIHARGKLGRVY